MVGLIRSLLFGRGDSGIGNQFVPIKASYVVYGCRLSSINPGSLSRQGVFGDWRHVLSRHVR